MVGLGEILVGLNDRHGRFRPVAWGISTAPSGSPDLAQASRADLSRPIRCCGGPRRSGGDIRIGGVLPMREAGGDRLRVEVVVDGEAEPRLSHVFAPPVMEPDAVAQEGRVRRSSGTRRTSSSHQQFGLAPASASTCARAAKQRMGAMRFRTLDSLSLRSRK